MYQDNTTVSKGEWLLTYILLMIPVINIVMLFVWAFGSGTKPSKKNWAQLGLIIIFILIAAVIWLSVRYGVTLSQFYENLSEAYRGVR